MKARISDDFLFIDSKVPLDEKYLRKRNGNIYYTYWHFVRDFDKKYRERIENRDELIEQLRSKVEGVKMRMSLLTDDIDAGEYSRFFPEDLNLYNFQAKAVRFISKQKKVLLADDVGLGKTVIALATILNLLETENMVKFLIIVPASLRMQWLSEARKFINRDMFPDTEIVVNNKSKKERKYVYERMNEDSYDPMIVITSYALVRRDKEELKGITLDGVILDEATKIKNRKTKINKAVRKLFKDTEFKMCMTATPIENGLEDLYCLCEFLDKRRWHTKTYFQDKFCIIDKKVLWTRGRRVTIWDVVGYKNIQDARQKLYGMYVRRTIDMVDKELPDIITQNITLDMDRQQKKAYREVTGETFGELTREDILGKIIYLQEICDSPELIDSDRKGGAKVKEIKRLIDEELKYQKTLLVTRFKKFANILVRELDEFNPLLITGDTQMSERPFIREQFNEDSTRRLLIGTKAVEEGMNLQVASVLVNADLPWNPAKLQQRIGRLHRLQSEHDTIRMINLIMADTIEERILEILYNKGKLFEEMFRKDEQVKIGSLLSMSKEQLAEVING